MQVSTECTASHGEAVQDLEVHPKANAGKHVSPSSPLFIDKIKKMTIRSGYISEGQVEKGYMGSRGRDGDRDISAIPLCIHQTALVKSAGRAGECLWSAYPIENWPPEKELHKKLTITSRGSVPANPKGSSNFQEQPCNRARAGTYADVVICYRSLS